jgi:Na+-translocating ferredoxin:NAD+ oxidoreductase subunit B
MLSIVLISVAVIGGLGLVFGIGLGIASKKLAVVPDEMLGEVIELLPGVNCGGCGYPGCNAFAKALCQGNTSIAECAVCVSDNANKIAKVLGVEATEKKRLVARVMCVGVKEKIVDKFDYYGMQDCRAAVSLSGGAKACPVGCLGLGTCQKVCPFDAITVDEKEGLARVNPDKCTGCSKCAIECPRDTITMMDPENRVYNACRLQQKGKSVKEICKAGCIGCGICAKVCKFDAITMVDNLPVFDYDKCVYCGLCAKKCPQQCIAFYKKPKLIKED